MQWRHQKKLRRAARQQVTWGSSTLTAGPIEPKFGEQYHCALLVLILESVGFAIRRLLVLDSQQVMEDGTDGRRVATELVH